MTIHSTFWVVWFVQIIMVLPVSRMLTATILNGSTAKTCKLSPIASVIFCVLTAQKAVWGAAAMSTVLL